MPDAFELPLTLPAELGPAAAVISELRDRVRAVELEGEAERARTGGCVLGRRAVLAQSWRDYPASAEPRQNLRPQVASPNKWARIEALLRNRAFAREYASARERWQNGIPGDRGQRLRRSAPNLVRDGFDVYGWQIRRLCDHG